MSVRRFVLVALALGLLPRLVHAQPSAATSIVPATFRVVPATPGAPDPTATFTVTVNDAGGVPLPGEPVYLDFAGSPYVQPSSVQPFPGVDVVSCAPPVLRAFTNGVGVATFNVRGSTQHRTAAGGPP